MDVLLKLIVEKPRQEPVVFQQIQFFFPFL